MADEWTEHITRGEVRNMMLEQVSLPLQRIERDLAEIKRTATVRDQAAVKSADESKKARRDWFSPIVAGAIVFALGQIPKLFGK